MTFVMTILGGLLVGLIVLYVEYRYFQKKKKHEEGIVEITQHKNVSSLWIDTVNNAVTNLCKREGVRLDAIPTMKIKNNVALVTARARDGGYVRYYDLKIDKNGDILEIQTR